MHHKEVSLVQCINKISSTSMGLDVFPRAQWFMWPDVSANDVLDHPYLKGMKIGIFYIGIFCSLPWFLNHVGLTQWTLNSRLYSFQIYGGFWAAWSTASAKTTMSASRDLILRDILPLLSSPTERKIVETIWISNRARPMTISLVIGLLGSIAAVLLVRKDVSAHVGFFELAYWSIGWALLFTTSASVVITSQFYAAFSRHLIDEADRLFRLDPSRSALILSVSSLGQTMLLFWFGVAFSIALIVPVSLVEWELLWSLWSKEGDITLKELLLDKGLGPFVSVYLLLTGVFSIGLGTTIFLRHEAGIRRAVNSSIISNLRFIEASIADITAHGKKISDEDQIILDKSNEKHSYILQNGSYRNIVITLISLILPLILPIATLIAQMRPK